MLCLQYHHYYLLNIIRQIVQFEFEYDNLYKEYKW